MSQKALLLGCLRAVQGASYQSPRQARRNNASTDQLLNLVFQLGSRPLDLTVEERREVGRLFAGAIKPIQLLVERIGFKYRTCLDAGTLRKRSALQFLKDNYGTLPVGSGTLNDELVRANFKETISILDGIICKWRDVSDSDEPQSYKAAPIDTTGIPTSHVWWTA